MSAAGRTADRRGAAFAAEQAVLGALLLDSTHFVKVAEVLTPDDFGRPDHRIIFRAMVRLSAQGKAFETITLAAELEAREEIDEAGGLGYLGTLARETPTAAHVLCYANIVRDRADQRDLQELLEDWPPGPERIERLDRIVLRQRSTAAPGRAPSIKLSHVADIVAEHREPEWLNGLVDILERNVQAVLAGSRNTFKSFIATHWAMTAALAGESVVILNAEGSGLGRRVEAWMKHHAPARNLADLRLLALERRVNLNSAEVLTDLQSAIDAVAFTPGLIEIDTLSKYAPGLDENDNAEVAAFLATLSDRLRDRYRAAVLLVVHAGHTDPKRPRGASVLMANPDAEYIVERPASTAMTVTVSRERFKDCPALPSLAYAAEIVDLGRTDRRGRPITSLTLRDTEAAAIASPRAAELRGKAQRQLLAAVRANAKDGATIWTMSELREIGRKAGQSKNTARAAAEVLATSPFMVPSVGGWRLASA